MPDPQRTAANIENAMLLPGAAQYGEQPECHGGDQVIVHWRADKSAVMRITGSQGEPEILRRLGGVVRLGLRAPPATDGNAGPFVRECTEIVSPGIVRVTARHFDQMRMPAATTAVAATTHRQASAIGSGRWRASGTTVYLRPTA